MSAGKTLFMSLAASLAAAALAGCAAVRPQADYGRAQQLATAATGQPETYIPGQDDAITSRVEALLADGITVDEAIQIALLNNPSFQAAWMDVGMARADLVQAGLFSNPSLFTSFRLPAGGGLSNIELTIAQSIADLWQIPARKKVAREQLERAVLTLAREATQLAANTKASYYRALGAQEVHKNAQENAAIAQELLDLAVARKQAGAGTDLDINLSRSAVLEANLSVQTTRLAAASARRDLATALGITQSADELELASSLAIQAPSELASDRLISIAQQARLDLLAARRVVNAAEASLRLEYLEVIPSVDVGVAMERGAKQQQGGRNLLADTARASIANGGLTAPEIQPRSERQANRRTDLIVGPSVALPLPIFDQNQAQIAKAAFALQQARKDLEARERSAVQEIRGAADRLNTAWAVVAFYRQEMLPLAERSLAMTRDSYRAGGTSVLAVLEAQRFLLDARRRYLEALQNAAGLVAEVELAVGRPLSELIEPPTSNPATQPSEGAM
ncbi:MAG: hypothetical protein AMXMBFR13_26140 [Phycisphaerae bacterium]